MTPFQAQYGRLPPSIPFYNPGSSSIQALDELLTERSELLRTLKSNLLEAQNRMQQKAKLHRRELEFSIGDWVLLRLQPYRQHTVIRRSTHKLAKRYYGPFQILDRIGKVAYRLQLPQGSKIHHVFHISLLKPYTSSAAVVPQNLPPLSFNNQPISVPVGISATRSILQHNKLQHQVLVQWSDTAPENSTWESFDNICKCYPQFHLEDKVVFQGVGNDTIIQQIDESHSQEQISEESKIENEDIEEEEDKTKTSPNKAEHNKRSKKAPAWFKDYIV